MPDSNSTSPYIVLLGLSPWVTMIAFCGGCTTLFDRPTIVTQQDKWDKQTVEAQAKIDEFGGVGKVVEVLNGGAAVIENIDGNRIHAYQQPFLVARGDVYRLEPMKYDNRGYQYFTVGLGDRLDSSIINRPGFRFKSEIELEFLLSQYGDDIKESVN